MQFCNLLLPIHAFLHICSIFLASGMSPANLRQLLISHNFYRRFFATSNSDRHISNMNTLVWDPFLAMQALREVSCDSWNVTLPNTNIERIYQHPFMLTIVAPRWFSESLHFLDDERECYPWDTCSHLRNMLNAKHRKMGCAIAQNCGETRDKAVIMCKYRGGNSDEFGFDYGPTCTGCEGGLSFCNNGLCTACNSSQDECECRKTCRKEGVGVGRLSPTTCTCHCMYGHGPNCDKPCENQEQYSEFDICTMLTRADCDDPDNGSVYREFCPAVCSCRKFPV